MKPYFRLDVSYDGAHYSRQTDELVIAAVDAPLKASESTFGGSGMGFGWRDLEFYFDRAADAEAARERVLAAAKGWPFEVQTVIQDFPRED